MLRRLFGLGASSALNVLLTAILSLILGKFLSVDAFGITRTITAYLILLTMLGNFTLHDALAYFIVRSNATEIPKYFQTSSVVVTLASLITAIIAIFTFVLSGYWSGPLRNALIVVTLTLPALNLTILYISSLQALGSHRTYAIVSVASAMIPLIVLVPASAQWALNGWTAGRCIVAILLLAVSWYPIRNYLSFTPFKGRYLRQLIAFSRLQFLSGVLSLVLMSADIILLERLTGDLTTTANYGMAQLFSKSVLFLPAAIGRAYFRDISQPQAGKNKINEFIIINVILGLIVSLGLWFCGPVFIQKVYGQNYLLASHLLKIMSAGIVFSFLWNCISTINIAIGQPSSSAIISLVGSTFGLALLIINIPTYGAAGAAWAMNFAYAAGALVGLFLIWRNTSKNIRSFSI